MNRGSAKTLRRSAKTARGSAKKPAKTAKAARRASTAGKNARVRQNGKVAPRKIVRAGSPAGKSARISNAAKTPHIASPTVQPLAAHEILLKTHKYQVGQTVYYTSPTFGRAAASGSYKVVKLLPSEGDDYQYRIKSSGEAFERVAQVCQLDRA